MHPKICHFREFVLLIPFMAFATWHHPKHPNFWGTSVSVLVSLDDDGDDDDENEDDEDVLMAGDICLLSPSKLDRILLLVPSKRGRHETASWTNKAVLTFRQNLNKACNSFSQRLAQKIVSTLYRLQLYKFVYMYVLQVKWIIINTRCATEHCVINRCDGLHRLVSSRWQNNAKIHRSVLSICSSHIPQKIQESETHQAFQANGCNWNQFYIRHHCIPHLRKTLRPFSIRLCDMCTSSRPRQPPEGCFAMSDRESQWFSKIYIFYMHPQSSLRYVIFPRVIPHDPNDLGGFSKNVRNEAIANVACSTPGFGVNGLTKKRRKFSRWTCRVLQVHGGHTHYTPVLFERWVLFLSKPCGLPEKVFRDFDQSKLGFFTNGEAGAAGVCHQLHPPNLLEKIKAFWWNAFPRMNCEPHQPRNLVKTPAPHKLPGGNVPRPLSWDQRDVDRKP